MSSKYRAAKWFGSQLENPDAPMRGISLEWRDGPTEVYLWPAVTWYRDEDMIQVGLDFLKFRAAFSWAYGPCGIA